MPHVTAKQMDDAIEFVNRSFKGNFKAAIKAIDRIDDNATRNALIAYKECAEMIDAETMRVSEVAQRLDCSTTKVYRLIRNGKLGHDNTEGRIRVGSEHLAAFLVMESELLSRARVAAAAHIASSMPRHSRGDKAL